MILKARHHLYTVKLSCHSLVRFAYSIAALNAASFSSTKIASAAT